MCHDSDAAPPIPAAGTTEPAGETERADTTQPAGATVPAAGRTTLTSADGTLFAAYLARPSGAASGTGIVILPDVRGLHPFYERLADRLAERGHAALAIDYFGRTAGTGPRGDDFPIREHIVQVRREQVDDDIEAAIDRLRSDEGGASNTVFALGFCFGGRQAFFASRPRFGLAGVIGFYGGPGIYPNGAPGPTQRAVELSAPVLGLFGEADEGIGPADVAAFDQALEAAGVEHQIVSYPGAPHGFFDVKYAEHAESSADAWRRVLDFVDRHRSS